jgi:O-antigen/teichoic acid export membrane protein
MGPEAVAGYSLAAQLSQTVAGSAASALHFLFPHFANRATQHGTESVRRPVLIAFGWNVSIVIVQAVPLMLFGRWLLQKWAGQQIAQMDAHVLPLLVMGTACTALGVTGNYAMLALGYARTATWITLAAGGVMLLVAALLLPRWGAVGMAVARLACGLTSLLIYRPLRRRLAPRQSYAAVPTMLTAKETGVLP